MNSKKSEKDIPVWICQSYFKESELSCVKTNLGKLLNSNSTKLQGHKFNIELIGISSNESLLTTLKDFLNYHKRYYYITLLSVFVIIVSLAMFKPLMEVPKKEIIDICFNLYPSLIALGFGIYAFMLGLSRTVLDKLQLFATDKKQPFHVLCASTIWFIFTSFLILLISLATKHIECQLSYAILQGLIGYSLFLFIDLLLHMFSIRTFFVPLKK